MYAPLVASLLVLPFILLELINRGSGHFPFPLFGAMWLLAFAFLMLLRRWVGARRSDQQTGTVRLVSQLTGMALIGWVWISLVVDQWPCFMGVPNCD
jgi:hypothetical protein